MMSTAALVVLAVLGSSGGAQPLAGAEGLWQAGQDTTYSCLVCHPDKRRSFSQGVHSERGIKCDDCHGGNPSALETAAAHRGSTFDSGNKVAIARLCSSCHSDPN